MSDVLRIHFLVPDNAGPIVSRPAGAPVAISTGGAFRIACGAPQLDTLNRGTGEPWGVRCKACMETDDYKRLYRPKPGRATPEMTEETGPHGGCGCHE